jgi:phenylalanyl-tRNA synthetase beta subunit
LAWDSLPRSDDVTREIDIIEEIGRLHGFNNFLTTKDKTIGNEDLVMKLVENNIISIKSGF